MKTSTLQTVKNSPKSNFKKRGLTHTLRINAFLLALLFQSAISFAGDITIDTNNKPPDGTISVPYTFCFTATGDLVGATWRINPADALPPGLVLGTNGCISGTPTATGAYTFRVDVVNTSGNSDEQTFTISKISSDGDPHLTTIDGVHYDFQSAGEFIALRGDSNDNFEIQVRQTPVATNGPGTDSHTNLSTCVSLNTAVAARVGTHRITYQPNINGHPDSSGMQLRVDGALTKLGENGLDLGSGSSIMKTAAGGGIEIDFPNGAALVVTSNWWSSYGVWYLNLDVHRAKATRGIMGVIAPRSWLPRLPDGSSLGPMPQSPHDRFTAQYGKFANAWRVTDSTTLFDYAPGSSTATFTNLNWPTENAESCNVPGHTPLRPITLEVAQQLTRGIIDSGMRANAIFDVMITGEPGFAKAYLITQQVQTGTTITIVNASKDTTKYEEAVTFTATVAPKFSAGKDVLTGSVEFTIDGEKLDQVKLDGNGHAVLTTTSLKAGQHQVVAMYVPDSGSAAFSSSSLGITHTVVAGNNSIWHQWWFWVIVIILILILLWLISRKKNNP